jgi:hypothetical protein
MLWDWHEIHGKGVLLRNPESRVQNNVLFEAFFYRALDMMESLQLMPNIIEAGLTQGPS